MITNRELTYCFGKKCLLSGTCRRYVEGQRIIRNAEGDSDQHQFIDYCNAENRELYIDTTRSEWRPFDVEW